MIDWNASGLVVVFEVQSQAQGEEWVDCCGYFETRQEAQAEADRLWTMYALNFRVAYALIEKEEVQ